MSSARCSSPASSARRSATVVLPDDDPPATPMRKGRAGRSCTGVGRYRGTRIRRAVADYDADARGPIDWRRTQAGRGTRMTDVPEGPAGVEPERGSRRSQRVGDSGSPVGSTLSIVLAVVAVIAGFLILRAITDDDDDGGATDLVTPGTEAPERATAPRPQRWRRASPRRRRAGRRRCRRARRRARRSSSPTPAASAARPGR